MCGARWEKGSQAPCACGLPRAPITSCALSGRAGWAALSPPMGGSPPQASVSVLGLVLRWILTPGGLLLLESRAGAWGWVAPPPAGPDSGEGPSALLCTSCSKSGRVTGPACSPQIFISPPAHPSPPPWAQAAADRGAAGRALLPPPLWARGRLRGLVTLRTACSHSLSAPWAPAAVPNEDRAG